MELFEQINNGIYQDLDIDVYVHQIFDSNKQQNISKFEQLCNAFLKNNKYRELTFRNPNAHVCINVTKIKIYCIKEYFEYIINIVKKYPQIYELQLTPHEDINKNLCKLLSSSPHIKYYNFDDTFIEHLSFDWKKTYIRHITIDESVENDYDIKKFFEWFKQNPQIYSLTNCKRQTDVFIYEFLKNSPQHQFMNINGSQYHDIDTFVKSKRITMYETIKTILLIANHQHKFKKYAPKYIIKMMLEYLYDTDFLKVHNNKL